MTSIVDYISNFEHVVQAKIKDYQLEGEKQAGSLVQLELHQTDHYQRLVKDYARFCWIHHLNKVKLGALSSDELNIGLNVFEILYRS